MTAKMFTTKEIAEMLGVTKDTILNYVKRGKLQPNNAEDWQYDRQYFFDEEEVERFLETMEKPGMTTGEIAKKLNVSIGTVMKYIKEGKLPSFQREYAGKMMHFVAQEEFRKFFEEFLQKKEEGNMKEFYSHDLDVALYQRFIHENGEEARILHNQNGWVAKTGEGGLIPIDELQNRGFKPAYKLKKGKPSAKKGYVKFVLPKPVQIHSPLFKVVDFFYQQVGYSNLRMMEENETIVMETKPKLFMIDPNEYAKEIEIMNLYIIEGTISLRPKGLLLSSEYEVLYINVPSSLKKQLKDKARAKKCSMEELVVHYLKEQLTQDYENEGKPS